MDKYDPEYIDQEEEELIESIGEVDPGSLQKPSGEFNRQLKTSAATYRKKHETRMNIRIDPEELERIKKRAEREGLKYITGQLVDSSK